MQYCRELVQTKKLWSSTLVLGRPKGVTPKYSLKPLVPRLSELLGVNVVKADDCIGEEVEKLVAALPEGGVLLLENVRFHKEEEKNDPEFAKKLASLADLYVNDAFGTAHRAHASTEGVTKYLKPSVAGFLLQKELDYLVGAVSNPKRPFAAIVGGSKVSSKIGVIESLLEKVDILFLGGGMIFTFYKAQGLGVGASLVEEDKLELATSLMQKAKEKGVSLLLPTDLVVADKFAPDANSKIIFATKDVDILVAISQDLLLGVNNVQVVPSSAIPEGWMGLDIGPDSVKTFSDTLDTTKTVIWNGPMGVFEFDKFAVGTEAIAKKLAELSGKGVTTIIGGGDSVAAVEKVGVAEKMSHISTGGGASLELLEGKTLPGVLALDEAITNHEDEGKLMSARVFVEALLLPRLGCSPLPLTCLGFNLNVGRGESLANCRGKESSARTTTSLGDSLRCNTIASGVELPPLLVFFVGGSLEAVLFGMLTLSRFVIAKVDFLDFSCALLYFTYNTFWEYFTLRVSCCRGSLVLGLDNCNAIRLFVDVHFIFKEECHLFVKGHATTTIIGKKMTLPMETCALILTFDVASKWNLGVVGVGGWLYNLKTNLVYCFAQEGSNNVVEFNAAITCMAIAKEFGMNSLIIRGDSNLVIKQLNWAWRSKAWMLEDLIEEALDHSKTFERTPSYIPREDNVLAYSLANLRTKLDKGGVANGSIEVSQEVRRWFKVVNLRLFFKWRKEIKDLQRRRHGILEDLHCKMRGLGGGGLNQLESSTRIEVLLGGSLGRLQSFRFSGGRRSVVEEYLNANVPNSVYRSVDPDF
eukprot:Gb_32467 [translate_table: standard]